MAASRYTMFTEDEYRLQLRQAIDALKGRLSYPRYAYADKLQLRLVAYFLGRAAQFGEAAYRASDLPVVLEVLLRVLTNDLIFLFWVVQSEDNAAEYAKTPLSELEKMVRWGAEKQFNHFENTKTGEDATATILAAFSRFKSKAKSVEQAARECGLEMLYFIPFRSSSLAVHGNTFGLPMPEGGELTSLPAIIAFLKAASDIADGFPDQLMSSEELLKIFRPKKSKP